jgi:aspartate dehydrogenase
VSRKWKNLAKIVQLATLYEVQFPGQVRFMKTNKKAVGIIGYGLIGSYVYEAIQTNPDLNLSVSFVYDLDPARTASLPEDQVLKQPESFMSRKPDIVCELAHSDVSKQYGAMILEKCDYFALSVTAFSDEELERNLRDVARKSGTRLFIPHGGVMGLDALIDSREIWEEVRITMKKNPNNLDFARSGMDPATIKTETELYRGPTRQVCFKFPRNVNTHATVALGGIGFDRTHSTLIADPSLNAAVMEIHAIGGGVDLVLQRSEEITGVSGASTPWSVFRSIASTAEQKPGMHFC